jgi:hypothetical protein
VAVVTGGTIRRGGVDRAVVTLGVVSLLGAAASRVTGTFGFVHMGHHGWLVAVVGGLLATAAGWLGWRWAVVLAGAGNVVLAVVQALLIGRSADPFGGDGSTVSFWLGLGVGLLATALTPRPAPRNAPQD